MNPDQLQKWLSMVPNQRDLEALRNVVAKYPYAAPLHMMLAKVSEQVSDLDRREDLLRAGAHVPSRRALFAYMMGPSLLAEARAVHNDIVAAEEVTEEALVKMVWHAKGEEAQTQPNAEPGAGEHSDTADAQDPPPKEEAGHREAMVAAIASVIEQDVQSWVDDPQEASEARAADEHPLVDSSSNNKGHGVTMVPVDGSAQPLTLFGQWLQQRAKETGFGQPELVERGAAALIDAFLAKGDVRIGPVRESHESTEEWAKQSLVEDASLVTETMAMLYAQQGQMGRARKAYKLSL